MVSSNPNQTPPSTGVQAPVIRAAYIDGLAKEFNLENQQRLNLHAFVKLGSLGQGLTVADLGTRLYMLAVMYGEAAERRRLAKDQSIGDLKGVIMDLKIRLEETFKVTAEQRAEFYHILSVPVVLFLIFSQSNIRCIAQDIIYEKNRTSFSNIHIDVEHAVKRDQVALKLSNIFGNPSREKQLVSHIKRTASSVRNAFREDILASITPGTSLSLADFTFQSAMKYKRGGTGENLDQGFTLHNVLLRKFAFDNKPSAEIAEDEDSDDESPPPKKKRKGKHGGRIAKGKDFWSLVDKYFSGEIEKRTRNFASPSWKSHIDAIIKWDNRLFSEASFTMQDDELSSSPSSLSTGLGDNPESLLAFGQGEQAFDILNL